jgi:hypothetical protein
MFIYRFEDFLKQKHSLSELKTYPQLLQRSDIIGYTIQTFLGFSLISSINKTDCHDITEILLKVVLNIINPLFSPFNSTLYN